MKGIAQKGISTKIEKDIKIAFNIEVEHTIPKAQVGIKAFAEEFRPPLMNDSQSLDNLSTKISSIGTHLEDDIGY